MMYKIITKRIDSFIKSKYALIECCGNEVSCSVKLTITAKFAQLNAAKRRRKVTLRDRRWISR